MTKSSERYRPELDGIRGLAILAVLISHCATVLPIFRREGATRLLMAAMTPGWGGVDLFFVLSGFLITGILLRTKNTSNYFQSFYARRFLRIFPIYYGTLIALMLIGTQSAWLSSMLPATFKHRASYFLYLQNLPIFPTSASIIGHFWSLAVEEQFYLIWPVLVWRLSETALLRLCAVGYALALPLRLLCVHHYGGNFKVMTFTTSRMDGLLIGSAIAIVMLRQLIPMRWIAGAFTAGIAILIWITLESPGEFAATGPVMNSIGVSAFALLSGSLVAISQYPFPALRRWLSQAGLRSFGKYSYGMYVYHIPLFVVIGRYCGRWMFQVPTWLGLLYSAAMILATYLVAKLSFDLFESRILRLKKRFEARRAVEPAEERLARAV